MSTLPIFATLEPLEKIGLYTPLGIRFWDVAEECAVVDGLDVFARPPGQPHLARRAFQTLSGVYAFRNLPGMRSVEQSNPDLPAGVHPIENSPPSPQRFIVEVRDRLGRFSPVSFLVDVPYRGIYPTGPLLSPPVNDFPGFLLFSDSSRQTLPHLAVVRAQLLERLGPGQVRPAQYAILEVQPTGGPTWLGIANELGNVAVMLPYPQFASAAGSVSPPPEPPQTRVQSWDVTVRARYLPALQSPLDAFARRPGLRSLLTQPLAKILPDPSSPTQPELHLTMVFGHPLLIQTAGLSELWIEP